MPTILELFSKLREFDEALGEVDFEPHSELLNDTQKKIDSYFEIRSRLLSEFNRLSVLQTDAESRQEIIATKIKRLDEYLMTACKLFNVTEFKGHYHKIKFITQNRLRPKLEPTEQLSSSFPEYCKKEETVKFKWDREKLVSDYKEGKESALDLCEEYKSEYVRFSL